MTTTKLKESKIVYVPGWLRVLLGTTTLSDSAALSLTKLLDILTVDDVVFYTAANNVMSRARPMLPFTDTFTKVDLVELSENANVSDSKLNGMLESISTKSLVVEDMLMNSPKNDTETDRFLASEGSWGLVQVTAKSLNLATSVTLDFAQSKRDKYVFELFSIEDGYYGISFTKEDGRTYEQCLKNTIEMLCEKYPFSEVSQTGIFREWANTLY